MKLYNRNKPLNEAKAPQPLNEALKEAKQDAQDELQEMITLDTHCATPRGWGMIEGGHEIF